LDAPTVRLSPLLVRLNDLAARLEASAVWISESAVRLEAITGVAEGASCAAERPNRAVDRASRAAGTFSRADKRVRELAGRGSRAVRETFMSARSMRGAPEAPQWVEGRRRGVVTGPLDGDA